jgi:formate dehydrogenase assembly factor FdhD
MNEKTNPLPMGALGIQRYVKGNLLSMEDFLGKETSLTVELSDGRQLIVACTPLHLEELKAGILYSQSEKNPPFPSTFTAGPVDYEKILREQEFFSDKSDLFRQTGSVHSGQLMNLALQPLFFTEDMGRHNVLDKLIGYGLLNGIDLSQTYLMISSRMPLELVEKAYRAGIGRICSISAPTLEAVEFARDHHMLLLGMFRGNRFNLYSPVAKE